MALSPVELLVRLKSPDPIIEDEVGDWLRRPDLNAGQSVIQRVVEEHNQSGITPPRDMIEANFALARMVCGEGASQYQIRDLVNQHSRQVLELLASNRNI